MSPLSYNLEKIELLWAKNKIQRDNKFAKQDKFDEQNLDADEITVMSGIAVLGLIIIVVVAFLVLRNYECKNCRRQKNEKVGGLPIDESDDPDDLKF